MDPENVRTIVTGLVTVSVGVVPAVLLYRQNKESGARELTSRDAERASEDQRQKHAAARERVRAQIQLDEAARNELRQRFLRFLHAVGQAVEGADNANRVGLIHNLSPEEASELAGSAEDLLLDGQQLSASVEYVRRALDRFLTAGADGETTAEIANAKAALGQQMEVLRREMAQQLQHARGWNLEWLDEDAEEALSKESPKA